MSFHTYISAYYSKKVRSKKTETFSLKEDHENKDPFAWEFFVHILSLISVNTTEGQM